MKNSKSDNCSLRGLGLFIFAACPDEISGYHSKILLPEQMILLSKFKPLS